MPELTSEIIDAAADAYLSRRNMMPTAAFAGDIIHTLEAVTPLIEQRAVLAALTDLREEAVLGPRIESEMGYSINTDIAEWIDARITALKQETTT